MKKIFSVFLAVLMLAGLCCMSIAATTEHAVGTHGYNNTIADGVADIPSGGASSSGDVILYVGTVSSRYAVDVVFPDTMIIAAGSMTWNVNKLEYELDGDALENKSFEITIINYSDKPVAAKAKTSLTQDGTDAKVTLTVSETPTTLVAVTDRTAVSATITATLKSDDWTASVNKLIAAGKSGDVTIGTIEITIAKSS